MSHDGCLKNVQYILKNSNHVKQIICLLPDATRKLLEHLKIKVSDIGVIELNEAFAAQALAVTRDLGLPDDAEHVNPNGGAIALGHPL